MIARRLLLLIAVFLLFIDDDPSYIFERRENCRARANYDARLAIAYAPPVAGAFVVGERAVQNGDLIAETRANKASKPKRERDFGDEKDRRLPTSQSGFDCAQIDFRFAAAGNPVKQARDKFARDEPAPDFFKRYFLLRIQNI